MPRLRFLYQGHMPAKSEIKEMIGNRRLARTARPIVNDSQDPYQGDSNTLLPATHDDATLVTSELPTGNHYPVIDIDLECMLVPSSQPGHFHLFINRAVSWEKFVAMLEALTDAGIVQEGYLMHTKRRGFATVRYPGVTKYNEEERIEATRPDGEEPF